MLESDTVFILDLNAFFQLNSSVYIHVYIYMYMYVYV